MLDGCWICWLICFGGLRCINLVLFWLLWLLRRVVWVGWVWCYVCWCFWWLFDCVVWVLLGCVVLCLFVWLGLLRVLGCFVALFVLGWVSLF